jgi:6-phosphogluconolactonase (cycloisomerase 2 family)
LRRNSKTAKKGAAMKIGSFAKLLLMAAPLLAGCGDFWQQQSGNGSFSLSNSANISIAASSSGTSTITVTPLNSFTGTVSLTCAITSAPSSNSSPTTCALYPTSVSITDTTAQTATLTATSGTSTGTYDIEVTGTSSNLSPVNTTLCVEVGTGTCTAASSTSGNFYILNGPTTTSGNSTISGYYLSSGALTAISGGSSTVLGTARAVAIAPNGKFLYTASSNGTYLYSITNGVLGTGVQVTQNQAYALQVDTTDSWLVEAIPVSGEATFNALPINSTTGASAGTGSPASYSVSNAEMQTGQMVISRDDKYIFVALGAGGTIVVPFNSSPATGTSPFGTAKTIPVANTTTPGIALSVAVDPNTTPRLFYIGETWAGSSNTTGGLRAFTYASLGASSLVQASGSPIASGGLSPLSILPDASGNYVYVANGTGATTEGNITEFLVTGSGSPYTIAASTSTSVATGALPASLAEDSTSSYVFEVGSSGSPYFDAYTIGSSTGQLTSQATSTPAATSIAIVTAQ